MKGLLVNFSIPRNYNYSGRMGLSLPYISTFLKNKTNFYIRVFDFQESNYKNKGNKNRCFEEYIKFITSFKPNYIGISSYADNLDFLAEITFQTKKILPNSKIIIGGVLGTIFPRETSFLFPYVDYVIKGEGESSFYELLNNKKVASNVYFNKNKKVLRGNIIKKEVDINELGFPDREIFNMDYYLRPQEYMFFRRKYLTIMSSRGCFGKCNYCIEPLIFKKHTKKNIEDVVKEIKYLFDTYKVNFFYFIDQNFDCSRKRLEDFQKYLVKFKLINKIKYIAQTRALIQDQNIFVLLEKTGCEKLSFGIESGSENILKQMNKKIKIKQYLNTCSLIKKTKIKLEILLIKGYPSETSKDIKSTIEFIQKIKPDNAVLQKLSVIPNTPIYNLLLHKKLIKDYKKAKNIEELQDIINYNSSINFYDKKDKKYLSYERELSRLVSQIQVNYILSNLPLYLKIKYLFEKENILKVKGYLLKNPKYLVNLISRKKIFTKKN